MSEVENDAYRRQAERDGAKRQARDDRNHAARVARGEAFYTTLRGAEGSTGPSVAPSTPATRRSDPGASQAPSRHCPLCGSGDYTITGANRVVSIGIDWGARFHCSNCGASYR